jgi:hypothetical protein
LAPVNKIDYVLAHTGFMGSRKLSNLTIAEWDNTPLYFMDDIRIVFGPPTDYSLRFSCGRRHKGMVGPAQLFDSHRERWSLVLS